MPFPIQITILEKKPPGITVREWPAIRRETWHAIGSHWYQFILPRHFQPNAGSVYGYRRRTTKYSKAKREGRLRSLSPAAATMSLTKTGTLHAAMTQRGRVIRAFPTRFTVRMPGLPYTPSRRRSPQQPFLQGELTKLLKQEIDELKQVGKKAALAAINKKRESRTTVAR